MTRLRCHCGTFHLTDVTRWVLYPKVAHTAGRCGFFVAAQLMGGTPPRLAVQWAPPKPEATA